MLCLSQRSSTVDRLLWSLWHRSHSLVLLSKRPGQFLFTLFSFTSVILHPRFQEHMSLRSALLIRGLFLSVDFFSLCSCCCLYCHWSICGSPAVLTEGFYWTLNEFTSGGLLYKSAPFILCPEWGKPDFGHQALLSLQFRVLKCVYDCVCLEQGHFQLC